MDKVAEYRKWYTKYCDDHPEFDGFNDNAIDKFWQDAIIAGYNPIVMAELAEPVGSYVPDIVEVHGADLRQVVTYLYEDEQKHWLESNKPPNHIFPSVKALKDCLIAADNWRKK
jgi:hypothetical protein